ncbi:efflux RND transporter permease subunit [Bacteroidota bacterium]
MLDKLMHISLNNRLMILAATVTIIIGGLFITTKLPIDVFPDLTAPTVTIMTEAHGMAPEEVEMLVTFPIEAVVNGASGVRRVRSTSIQGFSTIWVEFDWGTDIYKARQIVNEKLQAIRNLFPEGVDQPILAPVSSIMGEIMMVGLTSEDVPLIELRTLADYTIRRRLLSVAGIANVNVYGGEVKQYQVQINPNLLRKYDVTLNEVLSAARGSNMNPAGGFFVKSGKEYVIRGLGRIHHIEELKDAVITTKNGVPILLRDVGNIDIGAAVPLGAASINKQHGVLIVLSKQPDANTLELTGRLEETLLEIEKSLPDNIILHKDIFKQSDFIYLAVNNVLHALIYGAILVVIILMFFLSNWRITIISVVAIPISLIISILFIRLFNMSINTMTLGGMAIAIGVLVDDAIIYVENVYRRLKENKGKPENQRSSFYDVIWSASKEIRAPIAMATFIIIVVFLPLFSLSGVEGRMLMPLGIAYIISIFASLLVAVTVTPAMSSLLFKKSKFKTNGDNRIISTFKQIYLPVLNWSIKHRKWVIGIASLMVVVTIGSYPFLGQSFLPEFNEGTFNISIATVPGTSLQESDRIGRMAEELLLSQPEIISVARRTGRTELDEHSLGSHAAEIEVKFNLVETTKDKLQTDIRNILSLLPGTIFIIGQPISHRIDHMLSGTRANIAVKIFGSDQNKLRDLANEIENRIRGIEGLTDLSSDQQVEIPQVRIKANRQKMALYGLKISDLDEMIDASFLGVKASEIFEGQNKFDLVVRYASEYRNDLNAIKNSIIETPTGSRIPLEMVADISVGFGPNYISRENVQRKIVVQANVSGRDLLSVVDEIKNIVNENINLPEGYYINYGGQFQSAVEASRMITLLSVLSVLIILISLYAEFRSLRQSILVMANLPLALIGGVVAILITDGIITIASMVGFVTLFGIAVRNGIIMVSHYNHLMNEEGKSHKEVVIKGSLERLTPILLTATTTGLALLPLALAADQPGSEIQAPMSIVILGGLITATFLNLIVIPVLFEKWGGKNKL